MIKTNQNIEVYSFCLFVVFPSATAEVIAFETVPSTVSAVTVDNGMNWSQINTMAVKSMTVNSVIIVSIKTMVNNNMMIIMMIVTVVNVMNVFVDCVCVMMMFDMQWHVNSHVFMMKTGHALCRPHSDQHQNQ